MKLFSSEIIENTLECYHTKISNQSLLVYKIVIVFVLCVIISLPFINVNISSQARGIIRSPLENIQIQSVISGEILAYYIAENQKVKKGDTLVVLNHDRLNEQLFFLNTS
ncbi:hypothetical protein MASR2M117_24510 [Paludibacter sp.]